MPLAFADLKEDSAAAAAAAAAMALTVTTVDLSAMDKECSALGGLFQQVVTDMKVGRLNSERKMY